MSMEPHFVPANFSCNKNGSQLKARTAMTPFFLLLHPLMIKKKVSRAVILMNLGSPDSTAIRDVRKYLMEFLMDGRVIDYPYLIRKILVGGIIVPFRTSKSAKAYEAVWTDQGSPLIVITKELQKAVSETVEEPVFISMRYGNPSMKDTYEKITQSFPDIKEILMIPLYPHYAMSSYETAVEYAKTVLQKNKYKFDLKFLKPYYERHEFINAITESIRPYIRHDFDHFLFSYHGIPERHILKSDITGNHCLQVNDCCNQNSMAHRFCYRHQCLRTTELVAENLGFPKGKYSFSFQSRLGRSEWLKPYTAKRLEQMPSEGIRKLVIACPAFVSDCLETLEEIEVEGRETFLHAGGESFTLVPCLNVHPLWVHALKNWITQTANGNGELILQ